MPHKYIKILIFILLVLCTFFRSTASVIFDDNPTSVIPADDNPPLSPIPATRRKVHWAESVVEEPENEAEGISSAAAAGLPYDEQPEHQFDEEDDVQPKRSFQPIRRIQQKRRQRKDGLRPYPEPIRLTKKSAGDNFIPEVSQERSNEHPHLHDHPQPTHNPQMNTQTIHEPKMNPQSIRDPQMNPQTFHDPQMNTQTIHDPQMNTQTIHDPQMNPQTIHDPQMNTQTIHDPQMNPHTIHDPQTNTQTIHEPKMNTQPTHNPQMNPQTIHEPKMNTQTIHDPQMNTQTIHEPKMNPQSIRDPQMNTQTIHDPQMNTQTIHDQQMNTQTIHERKMNPQSIRDPQMNTQTIHDPQMKTQTIHDLQVNPQSIRDPQMNTQTIHDPQMNDPPTNDVPSIIHETYSYNVPAHGRPSDRLKNVKNWDKIFTRGNQSEHQNTEILNQKDEQNHREYNDADKEADRKGMAKCAEQETAAMASFDLKSVEENQPVKEEHFPKVSENYDSTNIRATTKMLPISAAAKKATLRKAQSFDMGKLGSSLPRTLLINQLIKLDPISDVEYRKSLDSGEDEAADVHYHGHQLNGHQLTEATKIPILDAEADNKGILDVDGPPEIIDWISSDDDDAGHTGPEDGHHAATKHQPHEQTAPSSSASPWNGGRQLSTEEIGEIHPIFDSKSGQQADGSAKSIKQEYQQRDSSNDGKKSSEENSDENSSPSKVASITSNLDESKHPVKEVSSKSACAKRFACVEKNLRKLRSSFTQPKRINVPVKMDLPSLEHEGGINVPTEEMDGVASQMDSQHNFLLQQMPKSSVERSGRLDERHYSQRSLSQDRRSGIAANPAPTGDGLAWQKHSHRQMQFHNQQPTEVVDGIASQMNSQHNFGVASQMNSQHNFGVASQMDSQHNFLLQQMPKSSVERSGRLKTTYSFDDGERQHYSPGPLSQEHRSAKAVNPPPMEDGVASPKHSHRQMQSQPPFEQGGRLKAVQSLDERRHYSQRPMEDGVAWQKHSHHQMQFHNQQSSQPPFEQGGRLKTVQSLDERQHYTPSPLVSFDHRGGSPAMKQPAAVDKWISMPSRGRVSSSAIDQLPIQVPERNMVTPITTIHARGQTNSVPTPQPAIINYCDLMAKSPEIRVHVHNFLQAFVEMFASSIIRGDLGTIFATMTVPGRANFLNRIGKTTPSQLANNYRLPATIVHDNSNAILRFLEAKFNLLDKDNSLGNADKPALAAWNLFKIADDILHSVIMTGSSIDHTPNSFKCHGVHKEITQQLRQRNLDMDLFSLSCRNIKSEIEKILKAGHRR